MIVVDCRIFTRPFSAAALLGLPALLTAEDEVVLLGALEDVTLLGALGVAGVVLLLEGLTLLGAVVLLLPPHPATPSGSARSARAAAERVRTDEAGIDDFP